MNQLSISPMTASWPARLGSFKSTVTEVCNIMIWLLVLVLCGAVAVFGPAWVEIEEHATLADLLEKTTGQEYVLRRVTVTTSKDEH